MDAAATKTTVRTNRIHSPSGGRDGPDSVFEGQTLPVEMAT
jgi:hypothetical protein